MRQLWLYNRQVPLGAIINPEEGERVVRAAVLARRLADQQLNLANTSEGQLTLEPAPIIPTTCAGHKSYHGPLLGTQ